MHDYQKGKIYILLDNDDNNIYVGSSSEVPLSQRMSRHRSMSKRNNNILIYKHMNKLGVECFYIELIEDCPCERNEQLRSKKRRRIDKICWYS